MFLLGQLEYVSLVSVFAVLTPAILRVLRPLAVMQILFPIGGLLRLRRQSIDSVSLYFILLAPFQF